jgi:hypothetical protein
MSEYIRISPRLRISDPTLHQRPGKLTVKFDDPPGSSPARFTMPILHGQEGVADDLSKELKGKIEKVGVGGVYSGAYTDETYAILLIALGGVAGGMLGAIGQDVWNGIKKACAKVFRGRGAKRNVIEVAIRFDNIDVLFHFEDRTASSLAEVLDESDTILIELHDAMQAELSPLKKAKAIELRQVPCESDFECVLHSFRKGEMILKNLTKPLKNSKKMPGKPNKKRKSKNAEQLHPADAG